MTQRESVKEQPQELEGDGNRKNPMLSIRVMSGKFGAKSGTTQRTGANRRQTQGAIETGQQTGRKFHCKRCGRSCSTDALACRMPVRNATCFVYARLLQWRTQPSSQENAHLFPIMYEKDHSWSMTAHLEGKPISFKLDTGVEVTAIREVYKTFEAPSFQKPSKILYLSTCQALQVLGLARF